jgi:hypothetical protein
MVKKGISWPADHGRIHFLHQLPGNNHCKVVDSEREVAPVEKAAARAAPEKNNATDNH